MPTVSIISSQYRTRRYLRDWVRHVCAFAREAEAIGLNFEIIVIANDLTEEEHTVLSVLMPRPWFRLSSVERESVYASWNRGVALSASNFCTSWNVDDIRNPQAIQDGIEMLATLTHGEPGIVYFPYTYRRYVNLFGRQILVKQISVNPPAFDRDEFIQAMHIGPFYLYNKSAVKKVGAYDETYAIVGDYEWQARAAHGDVTFLHCKTKAGIFRNDGQSLSGSRSKKHAHELARARAHHTVTTTDV